jgi:hypothetical protein
MTGGARTVEPPCEVCGEPLGGRFVLVVLPKKARDRLLVVHVDCAPEVMDEFLKISVTREQ